MTLTLPFFGIQIGLFAVATAASAWAAHPFHAQWKEAARAVRAPAAGLPYGAPPGQQAGWHGQPARCPAAHPGESGCQQRAGSPADGTRQRYLYRRGYALGSSPESAAEELWAELGDPALPRPRSWTCWITRTRIRRGSNLEPLESVSLDDLDAAWEDLQQQMQA